MKFTAIIEETTALLRQKGRITYRTLKREFALDDEALEDLKFELIEGQELAVDKDSKILVWKGGERAEDTVTQVANAPTAQSPEAAPSAQPEREGPTGERRHLTVMFCDLVGSTALSEQLDPEELQTVVRTYQVISAQVIERYEGHIAQYLGDGLLVYFGYPVASEDAAVRAVLAGLGIVDALPSLNTQFQSRLTVLQERSLQVRIGIHTGEVVVGEMGDSSYRAEVAVGQTPNVAARIQGLAGPNEVLVSQETYPLVQGLFVSHSLGAQHLKGVSNQVHVYRIEGESEAQSRFEVTMRSGLTPLVGREEEVRLLQRQWVRAQDGDGQVVLLSGEAGIGKSRLVQRLKDQVVQEGATRIEFRCSPYHQTSALYPIIEHLQRLLQFQRDEAAETKLAKLDHLLSQYRFPNPDTLALFATLFSLPQPEGVQALSFTPQKQKQLTLAALVAWVVEDAEKAAVYCIFEDLQWADPSTLEFIELFIDQVPSTRLLALLTFRPEFTPPWLVRSSMTPITLNRLGRGEIEAMIDKITGGTALPAAVVEHVAVKTDGVPIFVEELTKMVIESDLVTTVNGRYELTGPLPELAIPSTLHDSLMARLDRLVEVKEVAQLGATLGREFSHELLRAVSPLDELILEQALQQLVEAELILRRGLPPQVRYMFRHALVRDTAYQSLLKSTRQQYHERIGQVLEKQFTEVATTQPELLAQHYTEAGQDEAAISYWQLAGQRALQRSAHAEAIAHLTQGLALLTPLPETRERLQQELDLQVALGPALIAVKGYAAPDVEYAYARSRELCEQIGDTSQLFPVLRGLILYHLVGGHLHTAYGLGEQLLRLAHAQQEPVFLMLAHYMLGQILFCRGELLSAHTHHMEALAIYDPQEHRTLALRYGVDLGTGSHNYLAWELWQLGYPDQALQHSQVARMLGQEASHPVSQAYTLVFAAVLHQFRREVPATQEQATAATTLGTEHGLTSWLGRGRVLHGWTRAMQGQREAGIAEMHQGLAADLAAGSKQFQPYFLGLLAEAHGEGRYPEEGLNVLAEAVAVMDATQLRFHAAELSRLKGALLLQQAVPDVSEAEACFQQAIKIAQHQQAKSWELRAATSLARLWQGQGKRVEARELLAPIYNWFMEGFDTVDLKDANALLEGVSRTPD